MSSSAGRTVRAPRRYCTGARVILFFCLRIREVWISLRCLLVDRLAAQFMYVAMGLLKIVASVSFLLLFMLQYFFLQELENIIYSLHTYKKSRSNDMVSKA